MPMRLPMGRRQPWLEAVPLDHGERAIATAAYDGGHLLATDRALWTVPAAGEPDRIFWDEIDRAAWHDPMLTVHELATGRTTRHRLTEPGKLPETLRERVTASIVTTATYQLRAGGGVRIAARRRSGEDQIRWVVVYERATDAENPAARAEAEQRLAETRATIGD